MQTLAYRHLPQCKRVAGNIPETVDTTRTWQGVVTARPARPYSNKLQQSGVTVSELSCFAMELMQEGRG